MEWTERSNQILYQKSSEADHTEDRSVPPLMLVYLPLEGLFSHPDKTSAQGHTLRSVASRVVGFTEGSC